jgi:hypothetical protein
MFGRTHRQTWRRRASRLMLVIATLLMVLCAQVTRIVAAGLHYGSMQCCCGVHESNEECGCPDCPAAHSDADHHDDDGPDGDSQSNQKGAPSMNRCGPTATVVALMAELPWLPVFVTHDVRNVAVSSPAPSPSPLRSLLLRAPDAPPPRRS